MSDGSCLGRAGALRRHLREVQPGGVRRSPALCPLCWGFYDPRAPRLTPGSFSGCSLLSLYCCCPWPLPLRASPYPAPFFCCTSRRPPHSTDRKSLMESLAAKLAAGPPAKPVGLVKQVDHTATDTGVAAEASSAEKALGGVLTGSLAGQSTAGDADKEAATEGYVWWVHALDGNVYGACLVRGQRCVRGRCVRSSFLPQPLTIPVVPALPLPPLPSCLNTGALANGYVTSCGTFLPCRKPREALFADLAAKLAAGPPAHPVGLVKQQEGPWEPAAGEASEAEKKLGSLLQESLAPKGDGQ